MKLLLDENLPHQFRHDIPGHVCETTAFKGWGGKKNGELLGLAAGDQFDALLTNDANLPHQQNLASLPIAIVVLMAPTNQLEDLRPLVPNLLNALKSLKPKQVTYVH